MNNNFGIAVSQILRRNPEAKAIIKGSTKYSGINGTVLFYRVSSGVVVCAQICGLPQGKQSCSGSVFGFHIHAGENCSGTKAEPFKNVKGHYNPQSQPHPCHAGDMPPLFGVKGCAFSVFLTDRFSISEIKGKTIIVHAMPDDFKTQPSGNAGEMMACGEIR